MRRSECRREEFHPKTLRATTQRVSLQQPNEMWLLEFEVCEVSVTVPVKQIEVRSYKPRIGGGKRRVAWTVSTQ